MYRLFMHLRMVGLQRAQLQQHLTWSKGVMTCACVIQVAVINRRSSLLLLTGRPARCPCHTDSHAAPSRFTGVHIDKSHRRIDKPLEAAARRPPSNRPETDHTRYFAGSAGRTAIPARLILSPPIPLRLYTLPYWSDPPLLIFDIRALWRSGLSKINNGGLDQYGAEPFEQQQFGPAGVEGVNLDHEFLATGQSALSLQR